MRRELIVEDKGKAVTYTYKGTPDWLRSVNFAYLLGVAGGSLGAILSFACNEESRPLLAGSMLALTILAFFLTDFIDSKFGKSSSSFKVIEDSRMVLKNGRMIELNEIGLLKIRKYGIEHILMDYRLVCVMKSLEEIPVTNLFISHELAILLQQCIWLHMEVMAGNAYVSATPHHMSG